MKKLIVAIVVSALLVLLSGCGMNTVAVDNVIYDPGFSNDYVYSVGYYNNRPYWGNNYYYYSGYNWGNGFYNGY